MGKGTAISWAHHTFNPWWGCQRVSPGCVNCYAEIFDHRLGGDHWGPTAERRFFGDKHWNEPLRWAKAAAKRGVRERVFCASMADVFEDRDDLKPWRARLWDLISATAYALDWLLLTKRPENLAVMVPWAANDLGVAGDPWPNVWLGTTVEDQQRADERIPLLLKVPAALRFLSCEPLLGPVNLTLHGGDIPGWDEDWKLDTLTGREWARPSDDDEDEPARPHVDWVIAGCESGRGARPAQVDWYRALASQCHDAGVPFFMKQMFVDGALCKDVVRFPEDLRIRTWPR